MRIHTYFSPPPISAFNIRFRFPFTRRINVFLFFAGIIDASLQMPDGNKLNESNKLNA